ncbi:hypothetical protein niasHT_038266 [Heterodera trifolii]|uniref:Uncharacterized protein n=1 Tax=Heterodera trifolii TaxID=157864 RepID=A0ABD2I5Z9_9BILA
MTPLISQIISHLKIVPETPQIPTNFAAVPIPVDADSVSLASDVPHSEVPPASPRDTHSAPLVLNNDGEQQDDDSSDMAKMLSPPANTIDGSQQPIQVMIGNRGKTGGGGGATKTLHVRRDVFFGRTERRIEHPQQWRQPKKRVFFRRTFADPTRTSSGHSCRMPRYNPIGPRAFNPARVQFFPSFDQMMMPNPIPLNQIKFPHGPPSLPLFPMAPFAHVTFTAPGGVSRFAK